MSAIRRLVTIGLFLALTANAAQAADRQVAESGPANADGMVLVENIAGSITVIGWDKPEIQIAGTLSGDVEELEFQTGKKKSHIEVIYPKKDKHIEGEAVLTIHVPAGSRLVVECVSASIEVSGVTGEVEASSISGDVLINGVCEAIEAESISGDVLVDGGAPELEMASISGKVKARGGIAEVEAETVSGMIHLDFERFLNLGLESVAGDATVNGALDSQGSFSLELHSGTLILTLPGDVNADFEVETFSGEIDNEFGQKSWKTSKYAPGRELEFTNGAGEARVRINTFSGDVIIRKDQ